MTVNPCESWSSRAGGRLSAIGVIWLTTLVIGCSMTCVRKSLDVRFWSEVGVHDAPVHQEVLVVFDGAAGRKRDLLGEVRPGVALPPNVTKTLPSSISRLEQLVGKKRPITGESSFSLSGALRDVSSWQRSEAEGHDGSPQRAVARSLMGPPMTPRCVGWSRTRRATPGEAGRERHQGTSKVREDLAIVAYPYHSAW